VGANGVHTHGVPRPFITVAETQQFIRQADDLWSQSEREAFIDFIARNPESGDVIPDTGGHPQGALE
jgi:hypothetical protein